MAGKSILKQTLVVVVLITSILPPTVHAQSENIFVRTELYFGTARQDLSPVTDDEWRGFLDFVITKKFPEGLTVLTADGQFQDDAGNVKKEKSFVLVLVYPLREWKKRSQSIEFIRKAYKEVFKQQSVLRVDFGTPVNVSF